MVYDHSDSERGNRCRHLVYSFRLAARVLLYASSHRQDNTYHSLCYTSRGTLAGISNPCRGRLLWNNSALSSMTEKNVVGGKKEGSCYDIHTKGSFNISLTRLRLCSHALLSENSRYHNIPYYQRIYKLCNM